MRSDRLSPMRGARWLPLLALCISELVNQRLRQAKARGGGPDWTLADAPDVPGALRITGTYAFRGEDVEVEISIWQGDEQVGASRVLVRPRGALEALADEIVEHAYALIK